jgi:hypothetical protein
MEGLSVAPETCRLTLKMPAHRVNRLDLKQAKALLEVVLLSALEAHDATRGSGPGRLRPTCMIFFETAIGDALDLGVNAAPR